MKLNLRQSLIRTILHLIYLRHLLLHHIPASILNKNDITLKSLPMSQPSRRRPASILNKNDITHIHSGEFDDVVFQDYASILNKNDITQGFLCYFDAFLSIFIEIIHFLCLLGNIFSTISINCVINLYNYNTR